MPSKLSRVNYIHIIVGEKFKSRTLMCFLQAA